MSSEEHIARGAPGQPTHRPRPQDSLLRRPDQSAAKRKAGEPEIYLSWDGAVYGPAAPDDVRAGMRASYYDESTTFWHEGLDEWRSLAEFPENFAARNAGRPAPRTGPNPQGGGADARQKKRGLAKKPAKPPKPRAASNHGIWIVILFCLLAIGATVGVILLLMLI